MVVFLKQLQQGLTKLLPGELAMDGAAIVLAAIVLFLLAFLWKVATEGVGKAIGEKLTKHSGGTLVVVFGVVILGSLVGNRAPTAGVIVVLALLAWLAHRAGWARLSTGAYVAVVAGVLLVSLAVEGMAREQGRRKKNEQLTVYVVLPFKPLRGEDHQTLLGLSASLRTTIGGILGSIVDVQVEPPKFSVVEDLDNWQANTFMQHLQSAGLDPDVVLINDGALFRDVDGQRELQLVKLLLRPNIHVRNADGTVREVTTQITAVGRKEHINFLAIRATLDLVTELKTRAPSSLPVKAERDILHNAVNEYLRLLDLEEDCPPPVYDRAKTLANNPSITLAELVALVDAFPPDESDRLLRTGSARARGLAAKLGIVDTVPKAEQAQPTTTPAITAPFRIPLTDVPKAEVGS